MEWGVNRYAFVDRRPLSYLDPYGLYCLSDNAIGGIGGAVSGTFSGAINGLRAGGLPGAFALGLLGGTAGAYAGYIGTSRFDSAAVGTAAAAGMSSPNIIADVNGGVYGGATAYELQSAGMRDSHAGIVGGAVAGGIGGALTGLMLNRSLRGLREGGVVGIAGAALGSAVQEGLRFFNSCGT